MNKSLNRRTRGIACGVILAGAAAAAHGDARFSEFTPLAISATPDTEVPIVFGNPQFQQRLLGDYRIETGDTAVAHAGSTLLHPGGVHQTIDGREYLYAINIALHQVYRVDLQTNTISVFASRSSVDLSTGVAVGDALSNPAGLAVDGDGNLYVVENGYGGIDDDIWFANDVNQDGDLNDAGEGLARWASNATLGSSLSALHFDPQNSGRAWIITYDSSAGRERTIEISFAGGQERSVDGPSIGTSASVTKPPQ